AQWRDLGFDEAAFLGRIGLSVPSGEQDRPPLQRIWRRPTADINGFWGGYIGPGSKTVIASEASAKLSFRLVPDQDPERVLKGLRQFFAERAPRDAKIEFQVFSAARAIETDTGKPWVGAALAALAEEYGKPAVM